MKIIIKVKIVLIYVDQNAEVKNDVLSVFEIVERRKKNGGHMLSKLKITQNQNFEKVWRNLWVINNVEYRISPAFFYIMQKNYIQITSWLLSSNKLETRINTNMIIIGLKNEIWLFHKIDK